MVSKRVAAAAARRLFRQLPHAADLRAQTCSPRFLPACLLQTAWQTRLASPGMR